MPELAAHLERVAKAEMEMALLKPYREQARLLRILTDQCQGLDGGARLIEENLAAALAACAREAAKDELAWAIDALKDMGHLDIAFKLLGRRRALERAVGEKGQ